MSTDYTPQPPKRAYTRPDITTEPPQQHRHHRHHGKAGRRRWSLANLRFNAVANAGKIKTKYDGPEEQHEMAVRVEKKTDVVEEQPAVRERGTDDDGGFDLAAIGPRGEVLSSPAAEMRAPAMDPLGDPVKRHATDALTGHTEGFQATVPHARDFARVHDRGEPVHTDKSTGWQTTGPYSDATPRRDSKTKRARTSVSHFLINTLPSVLLEAPSDRKARRQSLQPGQEALYPYVKPASGDAAALESQRRESRRRSIEASRQDPRHSRRYSAVDLDNQGQTSEVYDATTGESVGIARREQRAGDFAFM